MPHYQLFGRHLASDIPLPDLPVAPCSDATPWWTLTIAAAPAPDDGLAPLGTEPVMDGVAVTLAGTPERLRLTYDDTGVFEITERGRVVTWYRPARCAADGDDVRADVLGRVMAVALHAEGTPTLHGSGVVLGGGAAVFLAPKLHGKSTTAAALVQAGADLLSDDIVAVVPGHPPTALPGVPTLNLWRDSARTLQPWESTGDATRKQRMSWATLGRRAESAVPLAALYLLRPVREFDDTPVSREPLPPIVAALALVGQAKIGGLLGAAGAPALMAQLAGVAASVPVYRLTVPREFGRLPELVRRMAAWHDAPLRAFETAPAE